MPVYFVFQKRISYVLFPFQNLEILEVRIPWRVNASARVLMRREAGYNAPPLILLRRDQCTFLRYSYYLEISLPLELKTINAKAAAGCHTPG